MFRPTERPSSGSTSASCRRLTAQSMEYISLLYLALVEPDDGL